MAATEQQISFCASSDGVRVAFATAGDGPPLVKAANWLSHLEFDWVSPVWRHWLVGLSRYHTLIRYDERGNGLCNRVRGSPSGKSQSPHLVRRVRAWLALP